MPTGSYRFQVAACNANGPWSLVPAAVSFRIVPAWWATWWFRSLVAGACALFIGLVVRSRMNRTRDERDRLESAVQERTGELQIQKNVVERQKREIEELLGQARGSLATEKRVSGRQTPIVAMTAHAMQGDREDCLRSGFDDYISKPVDLQVLAKTIDQSRADPVV